MTMLHSIPRDGVQLAVWQDGSGYPILCLHGHPGSGHSMSVFTRHLAQRFQTIAPDLRGYGKSAVNRSFEMADHLGDLDAILDHFQMSQCLVLGWSLGGILAMELALRRPEKVSGLILLGTAARPRSSHPPVNWQDNALTGIASIINKLHPGWDWNIELFGKRSLYRYLLQQHTSTAYQHLADEGMSAYLQTSREAHQALSTALRSRYNRLADLPKIQCPCLVLAGAADRHITPESTWETAQQLQNCEWHCYPNTAHLFPWEISSQMLDDIDRWLTDFPAATCP